MFHIRGEGQLVRWGFNFYPWSERRYSIGFIFAITNHHFTLRYAPHVKILHCYLEHRGDSTSSI